MAAADIEELLVRRGRLVFDAAPADKQFLDIRGGHNDGFLAAGEIYTNGIDRFITRALGR